MKRVRFFIGVLKPLSFLSLGGVLGSKRSLRLGSAVDGVSEAVVATDQRDCEWVVNFGARRPWGVASASEFTGGRSYALGDAGNTLVLGGETVTELRL